MPGQGNLILEVTRCYSANIREVAGERHMRACYSAPHRNSGGRGNVWRPPAALVDVY